MKTHDFDLKLQEEFNRRLKEIPRVDWKSWLDLLSWEDFEDLALKLSRLPSDVLVSVHGKTTNPRTVSVDPNSNLPEICSDDSCFLCHTSGTSGGDAKNLKWYLHSKDVIKSLWAPGMQAIFESSGLVKGSSAVIFVPSRMKGDGLSSDGKLIRLYSSEFSQRLVLSLIKPGAYIFDEYRNSRSLLLLSRLLEMEKPIVVSAPSSTVLGWADLLRLRRGLRNSLKSYPSDAEGDVYKELMDLITSSGVERASEKVQKMLSEHLSESTLIFSTTGLTGEKWRIIRKFLNWKEGEERFTNLYVGSETGPFAASIDKDTTESMRVFPLTIPVIERKGKREPLYRAKNRFGRLLVSRMDRMPIVNLDTGDIVSIEKNTGLPTISGDVLRSGFEIKTVSPPSGFPKNSRVLAGDYFDLGDFELVNPRRMIACLFSGRDSGFGMNSPVLLILGKTIKMIFPNEWELSSDVISKEIGSCPGSVNMTRAIKDSKLVFEKGNTVLEKNIDKSVLLKSVRRGDIPKGVLKKWPFYAVVPPDEFTLKI